MTHKAYEFYMRLKSQRFHDNDFVYAIKHMRKNGCLTLCGCGYYHIHDFGYHNGESYWDQKVLDFLQYCPCIDMGKHGIVYADEAFFVSEDDWCKLMALVSSTEISKCKQSYI